MLTCIARGVRIGRGWLRTGKVAAWGHLGRGAGLHGWFLEPPSNKGKPTTHWSPASKKKELCLLLFVSFLPENTMISGCGVLIITSGTRGLMPKATVLGQMALLTWAGRFRQDSLLRPSGVVTVTGRLSSSSATKKSTGAAGGLGRATTLPLPFPCLLLCLWTSCHDYTSHF